jgi:hypothetical protein
VRIVNDVRNKLNTYLEYQEKESQLYIPNEIFNDFRVLHDKGSGHVAFAYSYYYLISWLYRFCKYGHLNIDVKVIKEILGYNATYKKLDYLIKKNGVLDELGYTLSSTDFPYSWYFNNGDIEFHYLSELNVEDRKRILEQRGRNYKVKVPVKGLLRNRESEQEGYYNGIFYDISRTHLVEFEVFVECMSKGELGCIGFYLYGYLKWKCGMYNGYDVSYKQMEDETGINYRTLERYLDEMRKNNMITVSSSDFIIGARNEDRKSNTYYVNDAGLFGMKPISMKKGKVITLETHLKQSENISGNVDNKGIADEFGELFG